jgi:hypothetical protein
MKIKKIELLFEMHCCIQAQRQPTFQLPTFNYQISFSKHSFFYTLLIHLLLYQKMKPMTRAHLHDVAKCHTLVRTHMAGVERQFKTYDAIAQNAVAYHVWAPNEFIERISKHAKPILALMSEIDSLRKMTIRISQVQHEQINKYWKSIRDGRKTVKRGATASLESVTMETMIQMSLRVIQDMKDAIPSLIQPVVSRIHSKLCTLQQRMLLFKQFTESDSCRFGPDDCRCDCPPCRHGQCYECHEGNCCRPCQCNSVGVGISCHACHQGAHEQCNCNCSLRRMIK